MIRKNNATLAGSLKNYGPTPVGNPLPLAPPIANRLEWNAGGPCYGRRAAERREDVLNVIHDGGISENRINGNRQNVTHYPKFVGARVVTRWQYMPMSDSVFDRELVRQRMKEQGESQASMARLLNLTSQSAMSNILNGKRQVTADEAALIYRYLGLTLGKNNSDLQEVPVIGFTAAGKWREAVEMPLATMTIPTRKAGPRSFGLVVEGDSMDEIAPEGSFVVIDPDQPELISGKIYLLRNGGDEVTLKEYRSNPARFCPRSTNLAHSEFLASDHDVVIIGRAVWTGVAL